MTIFTTPEQLAAAKASAEFESYQTDRANADAQQQREDNYAAAVAGHEAAAETAKAMTDAAVETHSVVLIDAIGAFRDEVESAVDVERKARQVRKDAWAALNPGVRRSSETLTLPRGVPTAAGPVVAVAIAKAMRENEIAPGEKHWSER
jgi:hypothetical protein